MLILRNLLLFVYVYMYMTRLEIKKKKSVFPLAIGIQFPEVKWSLSLSTGYYELGLHENKWKSHLSLWEI